MADSIEDIFPQWTPKGDCQTVVDFFEMVVSKRPSCRFDVHRDQGKGWLQGTLIRFVEQKSRVPCVEAVLSSCVEGPHVQADPTTSRHFFLEKIVHLWP
jgi:hypothetical protein